MPIPFRPRFDRGCPGGDLLWAHREAVSIPSPLRPGHEAHQPPALPGPTHLGWIHLPDPLPLHVLQAGGISQDVVCDDHELRRGIPTVEVEGWVGLQDPLPQGTGQRFLPGEALRQKVQDVACDQIRDRLYRLDLSPPEVPSPRYRAGSPPATVPSNRSSTPFSRASSMSSR